MDKDISTVERVWVLVAPQIQLVLHRLTTILLIAHSALLSRFTIPSIDHSFLLTPAAIAKITVLMQFEHLL